MLSKKVVICAMLIVLLIAINVDARRRGNNRRHKYERKLAKHVAKQAVKQSKQIFNTRETNTPNFVRLVLMRLIYGVAAQFGFEERVSSFLNGAFVPPNADEDDFGLSFESDEDIVGGLDFGEFL